MNLNVKEIVVFTLLVIGAIVAAKWILERI